MTNKGNHYIFSQLFGYKGNEKIQAEDIISVIKFDPSGEYLSLGDYAGRVIIFKTAFDKKKNSQQYDYYAEFQSHTCEIDPLRSTSIQQSIIDICWLQSQGKYLKLLTTNSRNIKLWKAYQKQEKKVVKSAGNDLNTPKLQSQQCEFVANVQKSFPNKHLTSIHGISCSQNEQYLLSFDQVQAYLWNLENPNKPYIVTDLMKGSTVVQEVKQLLSCGKFHPNNDNLFTFGTNKGNLSLTDFRLSLNNPTAIKLCKDSNQSKNFFTELISNYSSVQFLKQGKYIAVRDFLTIKVWDICNPKQPLTSICVHQGLKFKLCQMFENQCIHDRFNLSCSNDGNTLLTGNYNNSFHLINPFAQSNVQYQLNYKKQTIYKPMILGKNLNIPKVDYVHKTTANDFNQKKNMLAVTSLNCFFIYTM